MLPQSSMYICNGEEAAVWDVSEDATGLLLTAGGVSVLVSDPPEHAAMTHAASKNDGIFMCFPPVIQAMT